MQLKAKTIEVNRHRLNIFENEIGAGKPTFVFLSGMGIGAAYYDFYRLTEELSDYHLVLVDLLGHGLNIQGQAFTERNATNIQAELAEVLKNYAGENTAVVAHSFMGVYLNLLLQNNRPKLGGLVFIDPTVPAALLNQPAAIQSGLTEAQAAQKLHRQGQPLPRPDADLDPALPEGLAQAAQELYLSTSGSALEINELENALATARLAQDLTIPANYPTLNFMSSLNHRDYLNFGNPYFNEQERSAAVLLNGHHFLHWLHPRFMAASITNFLAH
ncbi:alpha/beta hydrolase [Leuconostocaceae bacterium ESL0723]|nr:alpha/beta hydrolase [Leuconostocaceae bacterium ESL0723]